MVLKLTELIEKAKTKGLGASSHQSCETHPEILRPWQQESVLFAKEKPATNRQQTGNKPATKQQQSSNKAATNREQVNQKKIQTDNKVATEPTTPSATKWQQSDNKVATNNCFSSLVGLQRMLMIFIYDECKIARSKTTENISLEHISKTINSSTGSIKTTLQRLETKGFIKRISYKNGRGGWSKYSIPDQHFQALLHNETGNKVATKWQQSGNKVATEPTTQPATDVSSSSSNYINTTTTSETQFLNEKQLQLSKEWQETDLEPLACIGFTKTHLHQIASQKKLSTHVVQDSIYSFAFDLQENNKGKNIKGDPINFFMGILRNGKPYVPPSNYESPQDKAMRLYLENKREVEGKRAAVEKEAKDLAFNEWFMQLTDEQKKQHLPENLRYNARIEKNKMLEGSARNFFENEVWPELKNEITT